MKNSKKALFCGVATFVMWGLFPVYFKLMSDLNSLEILAHRIIWSIFFLSIIIKYSDEFKRLKRYIQRPKILKILLITGALIATNWGIYIYAINSNKILETSLGYFINPILSILFGAIFLKEKLSFATKFSILLALFAIMIQVYAIGRIPFISIFLPLSFAIYGFIKKQVKIPAIEGLFIETMMMFPFAILFVSFLGVNGNSSFGLTLKGVLLIGAGLATILPLITFNIAAQGLRLTTIGFLQYISPLIGIFLAVFVYGEELGIYKIISFSIIWLSLIIVSFEGLKRNKI